MAVTWRVPAISNLFQSDIAGHRIAQILQTPWQQVDDVVLCNVYVLLDTGALFELRRPGPCPHGPLICAKVDVSKLNVVDFGGMPPCNGDIILDVLECEYWPTIGLQLSSGRYLYCGSPVPGWFGACLSDMGDVYERGDVRRYWDNPFPST